MTSLVVNIGNTHLQAAQFGDDGIIVKKEIFLHETTPDIVKNNFPGTSRVIVGSVVPHLSKVWQSNQSIFITHRQPWSIKNKYNNPEELGLDRLANAEALLKICQPPYLVIDAGTAITFSLIGEGAEFLGGAICASPEIQLQALHNRTAQLPSIHFSKDENNILGKSPAAALASGAKFGTISLVEGMISRFTLVSGVVDLPVFITGGLGSWLKSEVSRIREYRENLTLEGYYAVATKS